MHHWTLGPFCETADTAAITAATPVCDELGSPNLNECVTVKIRFWLIIGKEGADMISFDSHMKVTRKKHFHCTLWSPAHETENTIFWMLAFRSSSVGGLKLYTLPFRIE